MATKCAHCGSVAYTRSSKMLSATLQEEYFQCSNIACGHTFTALREHKHTLSPPSIANPEVNLPLAPRSKILELQLKSRSTKDKSMNALQKKEHRQT